MTYWDKATQEQRLDANGWHFDIGSAPRGKTVTASKQVGKNTVEISEFSPDPVWLATKCGKVLHSRWIPASGSQPARWSGLATGEQPLAWQAYVIPEFPFNALLPEPVE
jgi:hypothetical protein